MTNRFQLAHDQFGKRWMIGNMARRNIWDLQERKSFPYVSIKTDKYQLKLFERGPNRMITLDPDVEFQHPRQIQLNPSGTHFSFVYQGQIWVAAIADMLP